MRRQSVVVLGAVAMGLVFAGFALQRNTAAEEFEAAIRELPYRPLEGRLAGMPYAPPPSQRRPNDLDAIRAELEVRKVAWVAAIREREPATLAAVIAGGSEGTLQRLAMITSSDDASAKSWSDYTAVLVANAPSDDPRRLLNALAAVEQSLELEPELPEALFNRGVVLEALCFRRAAAKAYDRYLVVDSSSNWAEEARGRARKLRIELAAAKPKLDLAALWHAANSGNELTIADAAIAHPAEARRLAEGLVLDHWAHNFLRTNSSAHTALAICRLIGRTLEEQQGDALLADTVRAIDAARDPTDLARAHIDYRRGTTNRIYGRPYIDDLREANRLFAAHQSPMSFVVREKIAAGGSADMQSEVDALMRLASPRYPRLMADLHYLAALTAARDGLLNEARDRYRAAYGAYAAQGEESRASFTSKQLATILMHSGDTVGAWHARSESLAHAAASDDEQLMFTIRQIAVDALFEKRWDVAYGLLHAYVDSNPFDVQHHGVLIWRAAAASRAGLNRSARIHLDTAHAAVRDLNKPIRDSHLDELEFVEALVDGRRDSSDTPVKPVLGGGARVSFGREGGLRRAAEIVHRDKRVGGRALQDAFIGDASEAYRILADARDAEGEFSQALQILEQLRTRNADAPQASLPLQSHPAIQSDMALTSYGEVFDYLPTYGTEAAVIHEFVGAATGGERLLATFPGKTDSLQTPAFVERPHDRDNDAAVARLPPQFHASIPPDTVLISYGAFADRLLIHAIDTRGIQRVSVPLPAAERERLVAGFANAFAKGPDRAVHIAGRALHRVLIEPVAATVGRARRIVVVQDPAFRDVRFGALMQDGNRYLARDYTVAMTPSITWFLGALQRKPPTSRALLAVGNPDLDERFRSLPDLSHAEKEAEEIAALYPSKAMLLGENATKERVIGALGHCDAAHFGVHAVAAIGDVPMPFLLLSRSGPDDDGKLYASDIAQLDLTGVRTVVLAGCRTAAVAAQRREERSLADAFLAAGAGSVVGSLWEIEDAVTRELSVMFHRELRSGATPADALRSAQLDMMRANRSVRDWASLQLYGSGR
jgi:CHAT domain-containing protein